MPLYNISTFQAPAGNLTYSGGAASGGIGAGTAMFALAAFEAVNSIMAGRAMTKQAELNARIFEQQAGFSEVLAKLGGEKSDIARDIDLSRQRRMKSRMASTLMVNVAGSGLEFSGSPVAVLLDNLTQYGIDEEITKYNYAMQKTSAQYGRKIEGIGYQSKASQVMYEGRLAKTTAYSTAFSSMLKGATRYALYKKGTGGTKTTDIAGVL